MKIIHFFPPTYTIYYRKKLGRNFIGDKMADIDNELEEYKAIVTPTACKWSAKVIYFNYRNRSGLMFFCSNNNPFVAVVHDFIVGQPTRFYMLWEEFRLLRVPSVSPIVRRKILEIDSWWLKEFKDSYVIIKQKKLGDIYKKQIR